MPKTGPCEFCGGTNYEPSLGGPTICPSCDCGDFGPDVVRRLGAEIVALRAKLAHAERLVRVDLALARQLREAIERNADLHERFGRLRIEIEHWRETDPYARPVLTRVIAIMKQS